MFDIHIYLDAATLSIFGMFALWAAGSTRHWFVRTAVAAGALLFLLFLPAYDLVIQFGIEMLMVVTGMEWWRRRARRRQQSDATVAAQVIRPQISLQTLLLFTVVVAVATPVLARAAHLNAYSWTAAVTNGIQCGLITLVCAWLVAGSTRWQISAALVIPLLMVLTLALAAIDLGHELGNSWLRFGGTWQQAIAPALLAKSKHWILLLSMAVPMVCGWLYLMITAGWYSTIGEGQTLAFHFDVSRRHQQLARVALIAWTLAILALPIYLFLQLVAPLPPFERESPRHVAGYSDLVAGGKLIGMADANGLMYRQQLTADQLSERLAAQTDAFERMRKAFTEPSPPQDSYTAADNESVRHLAWALDAKLDLAERRQSSEMWTETNEDWLHLLPILREEKEFVSDFNLSEVEQPLVSSIWKSQLSLSPAQLRTLVAAMQAHETQMPNWLQERQRLWAEQAKAGWKAHLRQLLDEWSGIDRYSRQREVYAIARARFRLLMVELAIDAFQREHGRPPRDLDELVPDYLSSIPDDPYAAGPLRYRTNGDLHVLYSVGPDGDDDSAPLDPVIGRGDGDYTADYLLRQSH